MLVIRWPIIDRAMYQADCRDEERCRLALGEALLLGGCPEPRRPVPSRD
jgi:hypothetical protein